MSKHSYGGDEEDIHFEPMFKGNLRDQDPIVEPEPGEAHPVERRWRYTSLVIASVGLLMGLAALVLAIIMSTHVNQCPVWPS